MTDYKSFIGVSLLELFHNHVLSGVFILHMHHCIVEIRIELFSNGFDRFHAQPLQSGEKLFVDHLHTVRESVSFRRLGQSALKIVYHRQDLFNNLSCAYDVHAGLFLFCTLAVIIKFRHTALQSVGQILHLLFQFIFFLFSKERGFALSLFRIFLRSILLRLFRLFLLFRLFCRCFRRTF